MLNYIVIFIDEKLTKKEEEKSILFIFELSCIFKTRVSLSIFFMLFLGFSLSKIWLHINFLN